MLNAKICTLDQFVEKNKPAGTGKLTQFKQTLATSFDMSLPTLEKRLRDKDGFIVETDTGVSLVRFDGGVAIA